MLIYSCHNREAHYRQCVLLRCAFVSAVVIAVFLYCIGESWAAECKTQVDTRKDLAWLSDCLEEQQYELVVSVQIKDFIKSDTSDEEISSIYRIFGSAYLRLDENDQAIASFTQALEFQPSDAVSKAWIYTERCWANARRGYVLAAKTDCDRARWTLEKANVEDLEAIDKVNLILAEADLLSRVGRSHTALDLVESNLSSGVVPPHNELLMVYANLNRNLGDVERSNDILREVLSSQDFDKGERVRALTALAKNFASIGRSIRSSSFIDWALSLDPNSEETLYIGCLIQIESMDDSESIDYCSKLYGMYSNKLDNVLVYARALLKTENTALAKAVINWYLTKNKEETPPAELWEFLSVLNNDSALK